MIKFNKYSGIYTLETEQELKISIENAWDFFYSPENLSKITPLKMGFDITLNFEEKACEGQIITYKIGILPFVKSDKRVSFIYKNLLKINERLEEFNSQIQFFYGTPLNIFSNLIEKYNIKGIFSNEDYEPYAIKRDDKIKSFMQSKNIAFNSFKDHVIFHKNEITKSDGKPYTVYTPYSKKWLLKLNDLEIKNYKSEECLNQLLSYKPESFNFEQTAFKYIIYEYISKEFNSEIISSYDQNRDFPYEIGTSQLGIHLRFGTISIRKLVKKNY